MAHDFVPFGGFHKSGSWPGQHTDPLPLPALMPADPPISPGAGLLV
jgi:hypothetical protein